METLLPSFIASIVGYAVFGAIEGYAPLFGFATRFQLPAPGQLGWFGVIGIIGGLVGLLYAKGFYGIGGLFGRLPVPRALRPAIGGLLVGAIALAMPQVLGHRLRVDSKDPRPRPLAHPALDRPAGALRPHPRHRPVDRFERFGRDLRPGHGHRRIPRRRDMGLAHHLSFGVGSDPAPFVVVGMMACFGSIARAPLAIMLMVAEMTGSLAIVVPAMLAVGLGTLIVRRGDDTIYRSQLKSRAESPAHRILTGMPLLSRIPVAQAMARPRLVLPIGLDSVAATTAMTDAGVTEAPGLDEEGRFRGVVTQQRLLDAGPSTTVGAVLDTVVLPVQQSQQCDVALETLTTTPTSWVPVVDSDRRVVGTLAVSDMVRSYRRALQGSLQQVAGLGGATGIFEAVVAEHAPLDGRALREAAVPRGVIVTSIERGRTVVLPQGATVVQAGDRLVMLATPVEAARVRHLAEPPAAEMPPPEATRLA